MEFWQNAWQRFVDSDALVATGIGLLVPLVIFAYRRLIAPTARLRYGEKFNAVMLPKKSDGSPGVLYVRHIAVQNWGTKAAEDVEVFFNWQPPHIEQYPHLASGEEVKQDGRYVVKIPRLNAKEGLTFAMASDTNELPSIIYVRGKDAAAKLVEFRSNYWLPLWGRVILLTLLALGVFSAIYLLVVLFGWIFFGRVPNL